MIIDRFSHGPYFDPQIRHAGDQVIEFRLCYGFLRPGPGKEASARGALPAASLSARDCWSEADLCTPLAWGGLA